MTKHALILIDRFVSWWVGLYSGLFAWLVGGGSARRLIGRLVDWLKVGSLVGKLVTK